MINKGPAVSPAIASAVISLMVGGVAGYYVHYFRSSEAQGASATMGGRGGGGGMPGGGMPGGGMPGGGGFGGMGGGGQQPSASATLTRLVRNMNTVEQVQNQGLSGGQKQALLPVLTRLRGTEKLSDKECEDYAASINNILSEPQKQALQSLQPARGGMGGGGGYGRPSGGGLPAGGMGGRPAMAGGGAGRPPSGRGGMGAGMGGGRPDPERPFAGERERTALDGLLTHLKTPGAR